MFVARWALFDERDREQTVCLCKAHMAELRSDNPSRAAQFVPINRIPALREDSAIRAA
jgi:hypothetical protein